MKKILLVEDDVNIRENLEIFLNTAGYKTVSAEDGIQGLKFLDSFNPDLIISDIMMPHLNGFEFLQHVKEKSKLNVPPFIFLTAKNDLSSMRQGMNLGADDYIIKPYKFGELLKAVEARLKKQEDINFRMNSLRESVSAYVHHELRTPLISIFGYTDIILTDYTTLDKLEIVEMVEKVKLAATRLHDRIEKMMLVADVNQFNMVTLNDFKSEFNSPVLKSIISGLNVPQTWFDLISYTVEPVVLKASDELIRILLRELLDNAFKFSLPGKTIAVIGEKEEDNYILYIQNVGRSITAEEIESIKNCNPKDAGKFKMNCMGLGLVLVGKIMDLINGTISFEPALVECTIVKLTLPLIN